MTEERVERRLAAILAADVVGCSRMMEADELRTRARFNRVLDEIVRRAIGRCRDYRSRSCALAVVGLGHYQLRVRRDTCRDN